MRIWIALLLALALTGEGRALAAGLDDGIAAYRSGDYAKARELLGPLAEKGDYNAQFHMGEMTLKGLGGEASVDDAFGWYLKAATAGHAQAQANVGSMIALGLGEKRDSASRCANRLVREGCAQAWAHPTKKWVVRSGLCSGAASLALALLNTLLVDAGSHALGLINISGAALVAGSTYL